MERRQARRETSGPSTFHWALAALAAAATATSTALAATPAAVVPAYRRRTRRRTGGVGPSLCAAGAAGGERRMAWHCRGGRTAATRGARLLNPRYECSGKRRTPVPLHLLFLSWMLLVCFWVCVEVHSRCFVDAQVTGRRHLV